MTSSPFELNSLNGENGFIINGIDIDDNSGVSVSSAGDVNGDGFGDLIIGARYADPNGDDSGESYVVFGRSSGFSSTFDLSSLNGSNGFTINGIDDGDLSGISVSSAGDVNDDGFDDLIIGAEGASPNSNTGAGKSYVVFGWTGFPATFELSSLGGSARTGFFLNGIDVGDLSGRSVSSAGDVNGDGADDFIIGARLADPNGRDDAGQSYVVFGRRRISAFSGGFSSRLELSSLNGSNGFLLNGINAGDYSGRSVSSAGDVNGDGVDDLIIGADGADPRGNGSGESYVVYGTTRFSSTFELSSLDGGNGFTINGLGAGDRSGYSVSGAGDVNGDGVDDLIIGAYRADPNGDESGESYVVFGSSSGLSTTFELSSLNGSNGFILRGIDESDQSGRSISGAGDINGDGVDDLIIGARAADPNDNSGAGESYVVYGSTNSFSSVLELSSLDGSNGFILNGIDVDDRSGRSVSSAGDVNGDGLADLIIGADRANPNGRSNAGESYVLFGSTNSAPALDLNGSETGRDRTVILNTTTIDLFDFDDLLLTDADDTDLSEATLTLSPLPDSDSESLTVDTGTTNISANYDDQSGTLTLSGRDSIVNYRQVLSTVAYENSAETPDRSDRTITVSINDGQASSNSTSVTVEFNAPPTAVDDTSSSFITDEDNSFTTGNVLTNDSDPNDDELTVTATDTSTLQGLLTDNGDGTFSYDPNGQFETLADGESATDTFTYTIEDIAGNTASATVRILVAGVNDAPTVSNGLSNQTTEIGTSFSYSLPTNTFTDADLGDSLTLSAEQTNGDALPTWLDFDDNIFSGTANAKDVSIYYLQVTATDSEGASVSTPFALSVNPTRLVAGQPGNINETVNGTQGADDIRGFNGNDVLRGRGGNDKLNGGKGDDLLLGNGGNDILIGQEGRDTLVGGTGSDLYVLQQNKGKDTVQGFAINSDKIVLGGLSFSDIRIGMTGDGNSTNIVIRATNERAMVLSNVQSSLISESDFMSLG